MPNHNLAAARQLSCRILIFNFPFSIINYFLMLSLDEIIAKLTDIVGPRRVSTNPIDKINYQHTLAYGAYRALPDVIVRIESDAQGNHKVADILKFANEHKIPIVAKGGVGMGISSPLKGGVLLDMLGMDKILEVNPAMQYVIAEGGASVYAHSSRAAPAWVDAAQLRHLRSGGRHRRDDQQRRHRLWHDAATAGSPTWCSAWKSFSPTAKPFALVRWRIRARHSGRFRNGFTCRICSVLFTLAAGSMGIISKVCLRAIQCRREWLHDYCYVFRRDQLQQVQDSLMELVRGEVVYDIHFTDRWQYHWPMEEGLYDKSKDSRRRLVFSKNRC